RRDDRGVQILPFRRSRPSRRRGARLMETVQHIAAYLFIGIGCFLILIGGIGINRMPDVYTRLHAASVSDTLGAILVLFGLIVEAGATLVAAKLAIIILLLLFTGP